MTPARTTVLRVAVSAGLLGALAAVVDPATVAARLAALEPAWLLPALALTVAQVVGSAWRWRFTARRLGLALAPGAAVREYYVATFANQVLPGGVLGDVGRAGRHAHASGAPGPAARAVILERTSGQAAFAVIAAVALAVGAPPAGAALLVAAVIGGLLAAAALVAARARRRPDGPLGTFWRDARRALFARGAWPLQLAASLAIALSYVGVYALCGLALGTPAPATWLPLVPLVLLAMLVPVSVAGWGVREGAAAAAWAAAGLDPAAGTALAIAYGVVVLASSLPGLALIAWPAGTNA